MPPPPPALPDELLVEIFLRLPPDEPEWLLRASLASKPWLGRLTDPRFHARYRELHGAAPMLGFFQSGTHFVGGKDPLFVSTTKFPVCIPNPRSWGHSTSEAWDCRHGRLLLGSTEQLVVLDTISGYRTELDAPGRGYTCHGAAGAVLCAITGCDHRACHEGPSRVVFIGLDTDDNGHFICAYDCLPEMGEWSTPGSRLNLGSYEQMRPVPPLLIQGKLYFMLAYDDHLVGILMYDLSSKCLSPIDAPLAQQDIADTMILVGMEDGSLGFAHLDGLALNLWSWQMDSGGVGSWSECKVIDLKELLPVPIERLRLIGSVEGGDIIFVTMELGIYEINLKSLEWKNIWKKETIRTLIPCMRYYYPQEKSGPWDAANGQHMVGFC